MYAFCTSGWNAMTLSKSEIMPVKTAYSATHGVDRRPPAPLGPKQTNIQLPCLSVTMCSTESIKLPVGRWHLSVRLCQDWCATVRPAATHTPRTQSHHFYDILRNLFFFFLIQPIAADIQIFHNVIPSTVWSIFTLLIRPLSPSFCHFKIHII